MTAKHKGMNCAFGIVSRRSSCFFHRMTQITIPDHTNRPSFPHAHAEGSHAVPIFYTHLLFLAPQHFSGKLNTAADLLSSNGLPSFLQMVPTAKPHPARTTHASPSTPETGLDIKQLESRSTFCFVNGLAASSQRTYQSGQNQYLKYCCMSRATPVPVYESCL